MNGRDQLAIVGRTVLLIMAFAITSNMWRNPNGGWHFVQVFIVVGCIIIRERISYSWLKRKAPVTAAEAKEE